MKEDTNELKEWSFQIDEISANVYRVWGVDPLGRRVEKVGDDPKAPKYIIHRFGAKKDGNSGDVVGSVKDVAGSVKDVAGSVKS